MCEIYDDYCYHLLAISQHECDYAHDDNNYRCIYCLEYKTLAPIDITLPDEILILVLNYAWPFNFAINTSAITYLTRPVSKGSSGNYSVDVITLFTEGDDYAISIRPDRTQMYGLGYEYGWSRLSMTVENYYPSWLKVENYPSYVNYRNILRRRLTEIQENLHCTLDLNSVE